MSKNSKRVYLRKDAIPFANDKENIEPQPGCGSMFTKNKDLLL